MSVARELLAKRDKQSQQRGLLLVRELPTKEAAQLLVYSLCASGNEFIRATAAITLGDIESEDENVKRGILERLWESLQRDSDYGVRAACAAAMGHLKGLGVADREDVVKRLCCGGELARGMGGEWQVLFSVITALGHRGDKRGLDFVLPFLTCENELLVQAAVGAVGDIGDVDGIDGLLRLVDVRDVLCRRRVAEALGKINGGGLPVLAAVRRLARDEAVLVREAAQLALQKWGAPTEEGEQQDDMVEVR